MGMTIRHVVLVSGVLAAGAFVYVVGFSPMDESGHRSGGRSRDGDGQGVQSSSRRGIIASIRQALTARQMETADRMADLLLENYPQDPYALYYRATVDMEMGMNEAIVGSWGKLDDLMSSGAEHVGRLPMESQRYLRGWGKHGVGEYAVSRAVFHELANEVESSRSGEFGVIGNPRVLYGLACYRAMEGDLEAAIGHWERATMLGYQDNGWWRVDPDLAVLHENPRFWAAGEIIDENVSGVEDRDSGDSGG